MSLTEEQVETTIDMPPERPPRRRLRSLGMDRFSGLYVWVLICVFFAITEPNTFRTLANVRVVAANQAIAAILAMGLVLALSTGMFDISIGATMSWAIMFVAWLQSTAHLNWVLAVVITVVSGVVIGVFNGIVVVKLRVDSLIATLGTSAVLQGLAYWLSGGRSIVSGIAPGFLKFGQSQPATVPIPVIYMAVIGLMFWFLLEHTTTGRYMTATGGSPQACRLAGLPVSRLQIGALIASGAVAALGGAVYTARVGSAALEAGTPYLLPAFAAAFLGSTQLRPGRFNIQGTLLAIFLLATGVQGLQLHWTDVPWIQNVFQGLTLILAVALAARGARRRRAASTSRA